MYIKYHIITLVFAIFISLNVGCSTEVTVDNFEQSNTLHSSTRAVFGADYYWYKGTKIHITELTNKKIVIYNVATESLFKSRLKSQDISLDTTNTYSYQKPILSEINGLNMTKKGIEENLKYTIIEGTKAVIPLVNMAEVVYEAFFYQSENGEELGVSNLFYIKLKSEKDIDKLKILSDENNVKILGANTFMPLWITLSCSNSSSGNALHMANVFYETNLFADVDVDFMMDKIQSVNDPLFGIQWGLYNQLSNIDIKYLEAREITQGSNDIIVAIVDQGVDLNHQDLLNTSLSLSYDSQSGTSPCVIRGYHGTPCAGIIGAATNNDTGIASIAPNSTLMSISNSLLLNDINTKQTIANGIIWAVLNNASVISNSWGHNNLQSPMIDEAITIALTNGRNGKGCVVVFAAGNNGNDVVYPANSISDILTVGSIGANGYRASSSCYGPTIDIVAPGVNITSTDLSGSVGYTSGDYVNDFSGTSASCPHVSGVAALILSINPELTQKEVANIIEKSARKLPNYSFSTYSGRPNGTWNNEVGYGLLDAHAALLLAQDSNPQEVEFNNRTVTTNTTVQGEIVKSSNVIVQNNANLTINTNQEVTINLPFTVNYGSTFTMALL